MAQVPETQCGGGGGGAGGIKRESKKKSTHQRYALQCLWNIYIDMEREIHI